MAALRGIAVAGGIGYLSADTQKVSPHPIANTGTDGKSFIPSFLANNDTIYFLILGTIR